MKYAFYGTPEFAAIILKSLITAKLPPALLICNPDAPTGRRKIMTSPPVKLIAEAHRIPVWQPEKLKVDEAKKMLAGFDFAVVAAYGKLIHKSILVLPKLGTVGVHPSLLPKYRGPSPIQTALLDGAEQTGISLFQVDELIDHGPVFAEQALFENLENMTYELILPKLAELSAGMLVKFLPEFAKGKVLPQPQNETEVTMTKKFMTDDARVDLDKDDSAVIYRKVRALNPEPGVWTMKDGKRMKILEADLVNGKLVLKKIHFEGKKPQTLTN